MFKAKYENCEFTYYEPVTGTLYYDVSSRLKHITNGDYSQYRDNPAGKTVNRLGMDMITIDVKILDESFTKIESDIKMLNHVHSLPNRNWTNTTGLAQAVSRLKKAGMTVEFHNETLGVRLEYLVDVVRQQLVVDDEN